MVFIQKIKSGTQNYRFQSWERARFETMRLDFRLWDVVIIAYITHFLLHRPAQKHISHLLRNN